MLALYNGSAAPQDGNDFINVVNGNNKTLQQMCPFFRFFQLVLCPICNHFYLELQILFENLLQGQNLWFAVDQCQQINSYGILQLRIAEQLIQNNLWVCIFFQFNNDPHSLSAGLVLNMINALNTVIFGVVSNAFNQSCLIDHIRDFGDDNAFPSPNSFKGSLTSQGNLAPSSCIGCPHPSVAHNNTACREIRPFDALHQFFKRAVWLFHQQQNAINDFAEVVRWNIGCHTNSDPR